LIALPQRGLWGAIGSMFKRRGEYQKEQAKFGKDREDAHRIEYEKEI
jgi:hypothetical protein